MLALNQSNFHSFVETSDILVVEFSPSPVLGSHPLAQHFADATFARVDPAREPEIAGMFGIAASPALLIFRQGIVLYLETGEHQPERVRELLARIGTLDIAQIRMAIAKERAEESVHMRRMCPAARRGPMPQ